MRDFCSILMQLLNTVFTKWSLRLPRDMSDIFGRFKKTLPAKRMATILKQDEQDDRLLEKSIPVWLS